MISKAQIKDIKALHLQKFRQIYNKFIAEGDKVCIEFMKSKKYLIEHIFITEGNEYFYEKYTRDKHDAVTIISARDMEQISLLKTPSNIFLLLHKMEDDHNILLNNDIAAIYLDGVQDPGNVGTIIRIADWFGIQTLIRSNDSADFFNPKVVQASMGSMSNVHLITASLESLQHLQRPTYGTYMDGVPFHSIQMKQNGILVMGNEGKGISPENEPYIQNRIAIPGANLRIAESLNVSIAAGIIAAEWKKEMM